MESELSLATRGVAAVGASVIASHFTTAAFSPSGSPIYKGEVLDIFNDYRKDLEDTIYRDIAMKNMAADLRGYVFNLRRSR